MTRDRRGCKLNLYEHSRNSERYYKPLTYQYDMNLEGRIEDPITKLARNRYVLLCITSRVIEKREIGKDSQTAKNRFRL